MADLNLDPQLMSHSPSPRGGSVTLPSRSLEDPDAGSGSEDEVDGAKEGDNDDTAGKKRRKLNLWKCKQCREARKKVRVFHEFAQQWRQCKPTQSEHEQG